MLADAFSLKELGTRVSNMQSDQAALTRYDHQRLTAGEQLKQAVRASGSSKRLNQTLSKRSSLRKLDPAKDFRSKSKHKKLDKVDKVHIVQALGEREREREMSCLIRSAYYRA